MKKILLTMVGALLLAVLAGCGQSKVDDTTAQEYLTISEEIITLLNEYKYEEVHAMFDEKMKEALPVTAMAELTPVIEESGDFKEIDKTSVEKKDDNYISVLVAKYSNDNRIFTISYNDKKEVIGLFIK